MRRAHRVRRRFRLSAARVGIGLGLIGAVTAAGVAYATIPDSNGVINACVQQANGSVRIIDPSTGQQCRPNEQSLSWNQTGQQGPPGRPPGPIAYASADQGYSFTMSPGGPPLGSHGTALPIPALRAEVHTTSQRLDISVTFEGIPVFCPSQPSLGGESASEGAYVAVDSDPTIAIHSTGQTVGAFAAGTTEFVTDVLSDGAHTVQVYSTDPGVSLTGAATCNATGLLRVEAVSGATLTTAP
jgi:hypothetical protein